MVDKGGFKKIKSKGKFGKINWVLLVLVVMNMLLFTYNFLRGYYDVLVVYLLAFAVGMVVYKSLNARRNGSVE